MAGLERGESPPRADCAGPARVVQIRRWRVADLLLDRSERASRGYTHDYSRQGFNNMITQKYPRSPKVLLGGMAHLARFIDKIRMRHAGLIQDYNYITVGFDKYLLDFLQIKVEDFEKRVLQGGTDQEILSWVKAHARPIADEDIRQWNDRILNGGPKDEAARQRFQARRAEIAAKRGVPVEQLPRTSTWVGSIELDEKRM